MYNTAPCYLHVLCASLENTCSIVQLHQESAKTSQCHNVHFSGTRSSSQFPVASQNDSAVKKLGRASMSLPSYSPAPSQALLSFLPNAPRKLHRRENHTFSFCQMTRGVQRSSSSQLRIQWLSLTVTSMQKASVWNCNGIRNTGANRA